MGQGFYGAGGGYGDSMGWGGMGFYGAGGGYGVMWDDMGQLWGCVGLWGSYGAVIGPHVGLWVHLWGRRALADPPDPINFVTP